MMRAAAETVMKSAGTMACGTLATFSPIPVIQDIGIVAAAAGAVLGVVSFLFDIRRKWRERNK